MIYKTLATKIVTKKWLQGVLNLTIRIANEQTTNNNKIMKNLFFPITFFLLGAVPIPLIAAQGDILGTQVGKLVRYSTSTLTKRCFYDVIVSGAGKIFEARSPDGGPTIRYYVPKGTTVQEALSYASQAWRQKQAGKDPTKLYRRYIKTISRITDCPNSVELIYNELNSSNELREK